MPDETRLPREWTLKRMNDRLDEMGWVESISVFLGHISRRFVLGNERADQWLLDRLGVNPKRARGFDDRRN